MKQHNSITRKTRIILSPILVSNFRCCIFAVTQQPEGFGEAALIVHQDGIVKPTTEDRGLVKVAEDRAGQAMVITPSSAKHWLKEDHLANSLTEILLFIKRMRSRGQVMQVTLRVGY
jgi:hypothetical protein